jgi:hypothetical protein
MERCSESRLEVSNHVSAVGTVSVQNVSGAGRPFRLPLVPSSPLAATVSVRSYAPQASKSLSDSRSSPA